MTELDETQSQIADAVARHPILLFMKGTPSFPQCGFSQRVVQILSEYGVEYRTFDVLSNPLVREGIKRFSNWPTIPQLYVKGEFIGGCDILVEMHEAGELGAILSAVKSEPAEGEASGRDTS
ncbi:MAG: Grx4 family monothiol glutaredoxin [Myxococcota bacterium]